MSANRELWADRETEDLLRVATRVSCPVAMIAGSDDPPLDGYRLPARGAAPGHPDGPARRGPLPVGRAARRLLIAALAAEPGQRVG